MKDQLYKVLDANLRSMHGGTHDWRAEPTARVTGPLVACARGIHLCRRADIFNWLGPVICPVAEYDAAGMLTEADKVVVRSATIGTPLVTWTEQAARLFACDCAERTVRLYWRDSRDTRPLDAIRVARRFAYGLATDEERKSAGASARASAWESAGASARASAWESAGASAGASAWASAGASAGAAMTRRLWEYLDGVVTPDSLRPAYEAHDWSEPLA